MSANTPLATSVTAVIAASPETLYDMVADVTTMHRYSPENTGATWLDGATSPTVGARFKGTNRLGRAHWSTKPTITADRLADAATALPSSPAVATIADA